MVAVHRALFSRLAPLAADYVTVPLQSAFNWTETLAAVDAGSWYLVTFRSVRRAEANHEMLVEFDDRAHHEALATSGLLYYFKGELNERRESISFCIWRSRQEAQVATRMPLHQAAVRITNEMYEWYHLDRFMLIKRPGAPEPELQPLG